MSGERILFVDPARYGNERSIALCWTPDGCRRVLDEAAVDSMTLANCAWDLAVEHSVSRIVVGDGGIGFAVADILKAMSDAAGGKPQIEGRWRR